VQRFFVCPGQPGLEEPVDWITLRRKRQPFVNPREPLLSFDAQQKYGKGLLLSHYLHDWGDCVGIIERKKAHVSILKGWPDMKDRQLALSTVHYWTRPKDSCNPPIVDYLISHPAFAGYFWEPMALDDFLEQTARNPPCKQGLAKLAHADALAAAGAWAEGARKVWEGLTSEPFPYGAPTMYELWSRGVPASPLS
jgi:hypothetical protein